MKRPPVRYFRLNLSRMTVGELWRISEGNIIAFLILIPSKIGIRIITPLYAAAVKQEWISIDPDEIPRNAMKRLRQSINLLEKVGFSVIDYGETPLLEVERHYFSVILLSADGRSAAEVIDSQEPAKIITHTTLATRHRDGSFVMTSNGPRFFEHLPHCSTRSFPGMSPDRLYAEHLERLEQADGEGLEIVPFTKSDCTRASIRSDIEFANNLAERGVLIEIPDEEVEDIFWRRGRGQADDEDSD